MGLSQYQQANKQDCIEYARNLLDMINTTYTVSNFGKEIRFISKLHEGEVKLYPTTGTYINNDKTFKATNNHNEFMIKQNIKYCIKYHVNDKL